MAKDKEAEGYMSGRYGTDTDGGVGWSKENYIDPAIKRSQDVVNEWSSWWDKFKTAATIKSIADQGLKLQSDNLTMDETAEIAGYNNIHDNLKREYTTSIDNKSKQISDEEYLRTVYINELTRQYEGKFGADAAPLRAWMNEQADIFVEESIDEYKAMKNAVVKLPFFEDFPEQAGEWINSNKPKNLSQLISQKITGLWNRNDKDSIDLENDNVKLRGNYSSNKFDIYDEGHNAYKAFYAVTGNFNFSKDVERAWKFAEENNYVRGKVIPREAGGVEDARVVTRLSNDGTSKTDYVVSTRSYENINNIAADGDGVVDPFVLISTEVAGDSYGVEKQKLSGSDVKNLADLLNTGSAGARALNNALDNLSNPTVDDLPYLYRVINSYPDDLAMDWNDEERKVNMTADYYQMVLKSKWISFDELKDAKVISPKDTPLYDSIKDAGGTFLGQADKVQLTPLNNQTWSEHSIFRNAKGQAFLEKKGLTFQLLKERLLEEGFININPNFSTSQTNIIPPDLIASQIGNVPITHLTKYMGGDPSSMVYGDKPPTPFNVFNLSVPNGMIPDDLIIEDQKEVTKLLYQTPNTAFYINEDDMDKDKGYFWRSTTEGGLGVLEEMADQSAAGNRFFKMKVNLGLLVDKPEYADINVYAIMDTSKPMQSINFIPIP